MSRRSRDTAQSTWERKHVMSLVMGAFKTRETADRAVDDLIAGGFAADRISVHTREGKVPDIAVDLVDENRDRDEPVESHTEAGQNIGMTAIGALGGTSGLSAGRETSAGLGGPMLGFLLSEGASPHEAQHYADRVHTHGDYVVAVRIPPGDE